jgi:pimeloyl-ACP methyl ester carboxylesterase
MAPDVGYLQQLVDYWRTTFDWRAEEARLNAFPQYKLPLRGIDLHFLHVPGRGPAPCPLLLLHGWPGSVFEFLKLIPRLTDLAHFGGDPADAFTIVAPSLPGYGLPSKPGQPRFGVEEIADCMVELMQDALSYPRFAVQGGDWSAITASRLGCVHPEKLVAFMSTCWRSGAISKLPSTPHLTRKLMPTSSPTGCERRRATSGSRARGHRRWPLGSPTRPRGRRLDHREVSCVVGLRRSH